LTYKDAIYYTFFMSGEVFIILVGPAMLNATLLRWCHFYPCSASPLVSNNISVFLYFFIMEVIEKAIKYYQ